MVRKRWAREVEAPTRLLAAKSGSLSSTKTSLANYQKSPQMQKISKATTTRDPARPSETQRNAATIEPTTTLQVQVEETITGDVIYAGIPVEDTPVENMASARPKHLRPAPSTIASGIPASHSAEYTSFPALETPQPQQGCFRRVFLVVPSRLVACFAFCRSLRSKSGIGSKGSNKSAKRWMDLDL